jgi:hypothetical protein
MKYSCEAAIIPIKVRLKSEIVRPLSDKLTGSNINGMDEIKNMRDISIFDFMASHNDILNTNPVTVISINFN